MSKQDEPWDELRRAWESVESELSRRELSEDSCPSDAGARESVEWMRMAWTAVDVPAAEPPRRAQAGGRVARRLFPSGAWRAIAALFMLAFGAWMFARVWNVKKARPEPVASDVVDSVGVPVTVVRPDRIEMRSGPVRLVLLTPESEPKREDS